MIASQGTTDHLTIKHDRNGMSTGITTRIGIHTSQTTRMDEQTGLLRHLAAHRFFHRLTVFNEAAGQRPTALERIERPLHQQNLVGTTHNPIHRQTRHTRHHTGKPPHHI